MTGVLLGVMTGVMTSVMTTVMTSVMTGVEALMQQDYGDKVSISLYRQTIKKRLAKARMLVQI